jgi:hypothetical protein
MTGGKGRIARHLLWIAAAVAGVFVVAVTVLLVVDWDSPRLGAAALRKAGESAGLEIEAEGFRLNLLRGLELRDVHVRGDLDAGRLEVTMERLVLEHRLLPLLSGRIVVDELVLQRPRIHLLTAETEAAATGREGPAATAQAIATETTAGSREEGSRFEVELSRIVIEGGAVTLQYEGEPAPLLDLQGFDVELRDLRLDPEASSALQGLSAVGKLTAETAVVDAIHGRTLAGDVRLAGGHLVLHDLEMPADLGHFRIASLELDLEQDPIRFALSLTGDPLTIGGGRLGTVAGKLATSRLELDTLGAFGESMELHGRGRISVAAGRLPDGAVIAAIDELLPGIDLAQSAHRPFEIGLRLEGDEILVGLFEIALDEVLLAVEGVVGLDETLDLRGIARAPRELLAGSDVPDEVLEALTGTDGLVHLPIRIRGTSAEPVAGFDRSQWAALARDRLRRELRDRAATTLGELLGGDRSR